jgi:hypothetical protein
MANLLDSSETTATTAPDWFTSHLSNIASNASNAAANAKFVGANALQEQGFNQVGDATSTYQPALTSAGTTLDSAGNATNPLSAANPYLSQAMNDPSQAAARYMNPYINTAVQKLSDIGQRNIQQNLSPLSTAAAVGSGQYGSKRGAQVLGQVNANAQNDLNSTIANQLATGYGQALQAATAQNQIAGQAGSTAASAASAGQQNLTNLGKTQADLASTTQQLGLNKINALETVGAQQQTIDQNRELFGLNNQATLGNILKGYSVPITTTKTMRASPLSTIGAITSGTAGFFTPRYDSNNNAIAGSSPAESLSKALGVPLNSIKDALGLGGDTKPSAPPVNPANSTADTNAALAKAQGAGYVMGSDGYLEKNGVKYSLDANNQLVVAQPAPGVFTDNTSSSGYVDYMGNPVSSEGNPYEEPI